MRTEPRLSRVLQPDSLRRDGDKDNLQNLEDKTVSDVSGWNFRFRFSKMSPRTSRPITVHKRLVVFGQKTEDVCLNWEENVKIFTFILHFIEENDQKTSTCDKKLIYMRKT